MTVEKPKTKQLLWPITTGAGSAMNQSQFLAITCNSFKAREKSWVQVAIGFGFGFDSHWLKNWRESFKPITKRSNRNPVITFDSHLKIALVWKPVNFIINYFLQGFNAFVHLQCCCIKPRDGIVCYIPESMPKNDKTSKAKNKQW